jgi:hypothetical protein
MRFTPGTRMKKMSGGANQQLTMRAAFHRK